MILELIWYNLDVLRFKCNDLKLGYESLGFRCTMLRFRVLNFRVTY
jgi:hypothetical protein